MSVLFAAILDVKLEQPVLLLYAFVPYLSTQVLGVSLISNPIIKCDTRTQTRVGRQVLFVESFLVFI
jgi:hypothetical protein